ncbi:hypothetical protein [Streptomyces sp. A012304]|uniref:hypothetical protein n=1 Tax=Streptomyces sp. A012304 TaxID=375446 RepID=UPI0032688662|nr:hypothetical protein ALMP_31640 [Streptomyces sp. A012304]
MTAGGSTALSAWPLAGRHSAAGEWRLDGRPAALRDQVIAAVAAETHATPTRVALAWLLGRSPVVLL